MELQNQHVSFLLSKRLNDLGFMESSLFTFYIPSHSRVASAPVVQPTSFSLDKIYKEKYRAYTTAELGEMLPWTISKDSVVYNLEFYIAEGITYLNRKVTITWGVEYRSSDGNVCFFSEASTEANTRAKALIHLSENNLFKMYEKNS